MERVYPVCRGVAACDLLLRNQSALAACETSAGLTSAPASRAKYHGKVGDEILFARVAVAPPYACAATLCARCRGSQVADTSAWKAVAPLSDF